MKTLLFILTAQLMTANVFAETKLLTCSVGDVQSQSADNDFVYFELIQNDNGGARFDGLGTGIGYGVVGQEKAIADIANGISNNLIGGDQQTITANKGKSQYGAIFFRATGNNLENGYLAMGGNVHKMKCTRLNTRAR